MVRMMKFIKIREMESTIAVGTKVDQKSDVQWVVDILVLEEKIWR